MGKERGSRTARVKNVTDTDQATLGFIFDFIVENQRPPNVREIGLKFGLGSTNSVCDRLRRLEAHGSIAFSGKGKARYLRVLGARLTWAVAGDGHA